MIRNLIITLFLLSAFSLFAQQQKENSDVQLPDFVITGKDIVTIRKAHKIPPDFVSTLSTEFIKPVLPVESLPVKELKIPVKGATSLIDSLNFINGSLSAGLGSYTLPWVNFNFSSPFQVGLFEAYANAENRRAYVANSDRFDLNGGANLLLSVSNNSLFLPGTQIKFHGNYGTSTYKFFGSTDPAYKRSFNRGNAYIQFDNLTNKYFIFSAKVNDDIASLGNENYSENMFNLNGFAKLNLSHFNLGTDLTFKKQTLKNDTVNTGIYNFIGLKPTIGLSFSELTDVSFGFNYEHSGSQNYFSPYAALALKISRSVTLYGEFNPHAEFWGGEYFLNQNPYFMPQKFTNIFLKKNNSISATVKYEYFTYFEIDGGFRYYTSKNLPYFIDSSKAGMFDLTTTSGKNYSVFVNLLFHPGPAGLFYGTAELNDTRDTRSFYIPYYPKLKVSMNYSYSFDFGLDAGAGLTYNSGIYTDLENKNLLKPFINLGANFSYKIHPNFYLILKISNLLNNNNYLWNGYKETPLNILAGLNFRW